MHKSLFFRLSILLLFCYSFFVFGQQSKEFQDVKKYFDAQQIHVNQLLKADFDKAKTKEQRDKILHDAYQLQNEIDSARNNAYIYAIIATKTRVALFNKELSNEDIQIPQETKTQQKDPAELKDKEAEYSLGIDQLREEIINNFYSNNIISSAPIKTNLIFVIERDGSISNVHAEGENPEFNKQAEISLYLTSGFFLPGVINGMAVKSCFTMPIVIKFD